MTKQQAADYLKVSTRAIERYAKAGKLPVTYDEHHHAVFERKDLQQLKKQMEAKAEAAPAALVKREAPERRVSQSLQSLSGALVPLLRESVVAALEAAQDRPKAALSEKLTLSLKEAAELSGLSAHYLTEAIHGKKLKAAIRGRGWNIKRVDLNSYVKKLS